MSIMVEVEYLTFIASGADDLEAIARHLEVAASELRKLDAEGLTPLDGGKQLHVTITEDNDHATGEPAPVVADRAVPVRAGRVSMRRSRGASGAHNGREGGD